MLKINSNSRPCLKITKALLKVGQKGGCTLGLKSAGGSPPLSCSKQLTLCFLPEKLGKVKRTLEKHHTAPALGLAVPGRCHCISALTSRAKK
jgi:hypothetical protein